MESAQEIKNRSTLRVLNHSKYIRNSGHNFFPFAKKPYLAAPVNLLDSTFYISHIFSDPGKIISGPGPKSTPIKLNGVLNHLIFLVLI